MKSLKIASFIVSLAMVGCLPKNDIPPTNNPNTTPIEPETVHLDLGNPSNASTDESNITNFLIVKEQFALSYHRTRGTANWVAWYLNNAWLGNAPRQNDFRPDSDVPEGWYRVTGSDYSGSGFDRGHLCPSADRTNTVANNSATFVMTNMIPQAPDNNQGPWVDLEDYTRDQLAGNEMYIYAGVYGVGGTGSNGDRTVIANGQVTVPSNVWKVIVILPNGENDLSRINENTRIIAVDMPNVQGIRGEDWKKYRVSVDLIEQRANLDFFKELSPELQNAIESKIDNL